MFGTLHSLDLVTLCEDFFSVWLVVCKWDVQVPLFLRFLKGIFSLLSQDMHCTHWSIRSWETRVVSLCCCSSSRSCMMPAKVGCCNVWRRRERNVLKAITSLCHFGKLVVVSLPRSYEEQKSASVQSVPAVYAAWDCLLPRALFFFLYSFFFLNGTYSGCICLTFST